MRHSVMVCVLFIAVVASGQDFTGGTAKLAKKNYEAAIERAKKEYIQSLNGALTQAKMAKDKVEEDRINETIQALTGQAAQAVNQPGVAPNDVRFKTVKIAGNKDPGMDLGKVKKGDKVTISYVSGMWAGFYGCLLTSPDVSDKVPCEILAKVGASYGAVARVPLGTKDKPFEYTFENDFDSAKINAPGAPGIQGEVTYRIAVTRAK